MNRIECLVFCGFVVSFSNLWDLWKPFRTLSASETPAEGASGFVSVLRSAVKVSLFSHSVRLITKSYDTFSFCVVYVFFFNDFCVFFSERRGGSLFYFSFLGLGKEYSSEHTFTNVCMCISVYVFISVSKCWWHES